MPLTVIDYHDLVAAAITAAFNTLGSGLTAVQIEELEDVGAKVTIPGVAVCPVGPEQERLEFGTNLQKGIGWPVVVMWLTQGQTSGAKSPGSLTVTTFRRLIDATFDQKRALSAAANAHVANCVCEVSASPVLFDKDEPAFSRIQSYLTVVAVGRFPRTA